MWRVAAHDAEQHLAFGAGAGTYVEPWLQHRPNTRSVRNVHNLYLEVLDELGIVGLVLLVAVLLVPLLAVARARREPLAVTALSVYVVWLVHAAGDWDWQMPVLTGSALVAGASILVLGRTGSPRLNVRLPVIAACVVLGGLGAFGLAGNRAIANARTALDNGNLKAAASSARDAKRWAPWAAAPDEVLATVAAGQGQRPLAVRHLRAAISKDPRNWQLWLELANTARHGPVAREALEHVLALNALDPTAPGLLRQGFYLLAGKEQARLLARFDAAAAKAGSS